MNYETLLIIAFFGLIIGYTAREYLIRRRMEAKSAEGREPVKTITLTPEQTLEIAKLLDDYHKLPGNSDRAAKFAVWNMVERLTGYSDAEWVQRISEVNATQYVITVLRPKMPNAPDQGRRQASR